MLKPLESFRTKWNRFVDALLHRSRRLSSGISVISLVGKEIHILSAERSADQIKIELCDSYPYEHLERIKSVLTNIVKKNQLKMKECIWILQSDEYQLLTIDALPVSAHEFQAAVRWKIKDLTNFPIDDVIVDSFPVPKISETSNKIMIVVARSSYLSNVSEKMLASGLDLSVIDVPELSLRNITALYEEDNKPTFLLYMQDKMVELLMTCQKQLYFTRRLTIDFNAFTKPNSHTGDDRLRNLEKMAIDIQRSLDYCQSQWRLPPPERFFLITSLPWTEDEIKFLSQRTNMTLVPLDLQSKLNFSKKLTLEEQAKYILEIGAILRTES